MLCPRKQQSKGHERRNVPDARPPHRPARSFARRCITSVKESTARDRRNRPSRSVSRRRDAPASTSRRPHRRPSPRRNRAQSTRAVPHGVESGRRPGARARFAVHSSVRTEVRRPSRRCRVRPRAPRGVDPHQHEKRRPERPYGPRGQASVARQLGQRLAHANRAGAEPRRHDMAQAVTSGRAPGV